MKLEKTTEEDKEAIEKLTNLLKGGEPLPLPPNTQVRNIEIPISPLLSANRPLITIFSPNDSKDANLSMSFTLLYKQSPPIKHFENGVKMACVECPEFAGHLSTFATEISKNSNFLTELPLDGELLSLFSSPDKNFLISNHKNAFVHFEIVSNNSDHDFQSILTNSDQNSTAKLKPDMGICVTYREGENERTLKIRITLYGDGSGIVSYAINHGIADYGSSLFFLSLISKYCKLSMADHRSPDEFLSDQLENSQFNFTQFIRGENVLFIRPSQTGDLDHLSYLFSHSSHFIYASSYLQLADQFQQMIFNQNEKIEFRSIRITKEISNRWKEFAKSGSSGDLLQKEIISTNDIISALLWKLISINHPNGPFSDEEIHLGFIVNFRFKYLPEKFVGNSSLVSKTTLSRSSLSLMSFSDLVFFIRKSVNAFVNDEKLFSDNSSFLHFFNNINNIL